MPFFWVVSSATNTRIYTEQIKETQQPIQCTELVYACRSRDDVDGDEHRNKLTHTSTLEHKGNLVNNTKRKT